MMDIPATQVCEDVSRNQVSVPLQKQQIGVLRIGPNTYPIKEGINRIGRQPDSDIVINDQTVSKKHAEIEADSHEASWVCDLHSSNRTKLNNSTLRPGRLYELKDGSVLEFGMARAIYKLYRSPDDSVNSETPAPNRTKSHVSIPETPDSSVSNSSDMENISTIPATQNSGGKQPLFRHPSLPLRSSARSNRKSEVQDSSIDTSLDISGSSVTKKKQSVSEQSVSIHDLETQNNSYNEIDIHDIETQKIDVINAAAKRLCERVPDSISDAETQKERNTNSSITDIHDIETQHEEEKLAKLKIYNMETQRNVDIHDMKTPKKVPDLSTRSDTETSRVSNESSSSIAEDSIHDRVTQKFEIKGNIACRNDDKNENDEIKANSQILITRFGNELPDLDESRNLIGSQNTILEDYLDESNDGIAGPSTATTSPHADANEKSSDDDNIFDAMTQRTEFDQNASKDVRRQVDYTCKTSLVAGDSDTEEGGVFQSYLYNKSQDDVIHITRTTNPPESQESDDSTTDEEGQFAELAMKIKTSASNSFDAKCNVSRKTDENNSTKDSDDFFDKPTQPMKLCHQDKVDADNEIFDARTQMIADVKINESAKTKIDDTAQVKDTVTAKRNFDEEDITEMEDNSPTQILSVPEETLETANKPNLSSIVEECSIGDIDYEMAPTQRINDIEGPCSKKDSSEPSNRVSLNDTIERNLGAMFEDVNEECVDEQDQISTQVLRDVLQSPNKLEDVDSKSPTRSKSTTSTSGKKSVALTTDSTSNEKSTENENTDDDSQTSGYFCGLTSKRKINVLADSQCFATDKRNEGKIDKEETAIDRKNVKECNTPKSMSKDAKLIRSTPKIPTTPKSTRSSTPVSKSVTKEQTTPQSSKRKKRDESETVETISVDANVSKNDKNVPEDAVDNKVFCSISTTGENVQQSSDTIIDSDEDMLANLPEVTISGTLSNPGSPVSTTSSEYRINLNLNHEKQIPIKIAPKKRGRKARVAVPPKSIKNAESYCELGSSTLTENSSISTAIDLDVDKVSVNKEKRKTRKASARKTKKEDSLPESKSVALKESVKRKKQSPCIEINQTISRAKSEVNDFPPQSPTIATLIDSQKEARQVLSIKTNRKLRNTKKKDADVSSLLQVGKEVPAAKVAAEPAKENVLNDTCNTRTRKRHLSTVDTNESNFVKKLKTDANEDESCTTRGNRRNAGTSRRQSATILNYVTRNDSPHQSSASSTPSDLDTDKRMMIKLKRVSVSSPSNTTGSISPITRAELIPENDNKNSTKRRTRATAANKRSSLSTSINKDSNTTRNTNRTTKKEVKSTVEEISSEIGEESQEIEMIMSGVLKKPNPVTNTKSKKDTKPTKTKSNRKRGNTSTDTDNTTNNSSSSVVDESDNAQFEIPVSKPKRMKNLSIADATLNASPNRTRRTVSMSTSYKHRISFTGVSSNDYTKLISKLGATLVEDIKQSTVLVTDKVRRTYKFLCALAQSIPIVSVQWLVESARANNYVDVWNYIIQDLAAEKLYKFKLVDSLERAKNHKLLEGYTVVLTPNVAPPDLSELKGMIIACGGKPLVRPPRSWPEKSVIVTREEDMENAKKFLVKAPKAVSVHSVEFILTGILRQNLNLSEFKLTCT